MFLTDAAIATVGPLNKLQDNAVNLAELIEFCTIPRTKAEMMVYAKLINSSYFHKTYLKPLLNSGKIKMTIPDNPHSRTQKYMDAESFDTND